MKYFHIYFYIFFSVSSHTIRSELLRLLRTSGRKAWDLERLYPASRCPFDLPDFSRKIQDDRRDLYSQGREYVHNFYSAGQEQCVFGNHVKVPNLLRPSSKHAFSALVSLGFLCSITSRCPGKEREGRGPDTRERRKSSLLQTFQR